ncbi:hypothetical protein HDU96_000029 [Phlyctochytrium bullatum]|nr:hypothetical protein HDU96_000029 [Phlyctochytrium bullatum]
MALTAPPVLPAGPMITPAPLFPRAVTTTATPQLSFCQEFLRDCANAAGAYEGFETVYTKCDNTKAESPMAFCIGCPAGKFSNFDACFNHPDSYPVQVPEYSQQMWIGLTPRNAKQAPPNGLNAALKPTIDKWSQQCAKQCKKDYQPDNKGESYYAWYGTRSYTVFSCGCSPEEWAAPRPFNISGLDLVPALDGFPDDNTKQQYAVGVERWGPTDRRLNALNKIKWKTKPGNTPEPNAVDGVSADKGANVNVPPPNNTIMLQKLKDRFGHGRKKSMTENDGPDADTETSPAPKMTRRQSPTVRVSPTTDPDTLGPAVPAGPRQSPAAPAVLPLSPASPIAPSRSVIPPPVASPVGPAQPASPVSPAGPAQPAFGTPAAPRGPVPASSPNPPPSLPTVSPSPSPAPAAVSPTLAAPSPATPSPSVSDVSQAPLVNPWNATTKDPNAGNKASGIKFAVASVAVVMSLVMALF